MVQSPSWKANWFAASQEIPRISRNPKVHYRTHKRPPPVSILGQPNPIHIHTSHLLEIRPNIIHSSTPRSLQWSLSLRFPQQDTIHPLSSPIRATCPAHLILLDFITRTILGEQYKSFSSSLCNLLHFSGYLVTNYIYVMLKYWSRLALYQHLLDIDFEADVSETFLKRILSFRIFYLKTRRNKMSRIRQLVSDLGIVFTLSTRNTSVALYCILLNSV